MARTPKSATKADSLERDKHRADIKLISDGSRNIFCTPNRRHTRAMAKQSADMLPPSITPATKKPKTTALTAKKSTKPSAGTGRRATTVGISSAVDADETLVQDETMPLVSSDTDSDARPSDGGQSPLKLKKLRKSVLMAAANNGKGSPKTVKTPGRFVRPMEHEPAEQPIAVASAADAADVPNADGNRKSIVDLTESPMPKGERTLNETFEESPKPKVAHKLNETFEESSTPKAGNKLNETFEGKTEGDEGLIMPAMNDENGEHQLAVTGSPTKEETATTPYKRHSIRLLDEESAELTADSFAPFVSMSANKSKRSISDSVALSGRKDSPSNVRTSGRFVQPLENTNDDSPKKLDGTFDAEDKDKAVGDRKSIVDLTESPKPPIVSKLDETFEEKVDTKKDVQGN